eukprot:363350-Chlamydomonas_euryale.AAC.6
MRRSRCGQAGVECARTGHKCVECARTGHRCVESIIPYAPMRARPTGSRPMSGPRPPTCPPSPNARKSVDSLLPHATPPQTRASVPTHSSHMPPLPKRAQVCRLTPPTCPCRL